MNKPIDTLIVDKIIAAVCWLKGHAWLTPLHGKRVCNRCGKRQDRSPVTQYRWVDVECVVKPFNPID